MLKVLEKKVAFCRTGRAALSSEWRRRNSFCEHLCMLEDRSLKAKRLGDTAERRNCQHEIRTERERAGREKNSLPLFLYAAQFVPLGDYSIATFMLVL